jgi:hypothetical protein
MGAQATTEIRQRFVQHHPVHINATERAVTRDKLAAIRTLAANPSTRPSIAIVELGAGDANNRHGDARMRRDIREVLFALRLVPCVRWLNLKLAGVNGYYQGYVQRADDFNRILAQEVQRFPNAQVGRYRQWALANPRAFKADGLHHTAGGKRLFAAFLDRDVADRCEA